MSDKKFDALTPFHNNVILRRNENEEKMYGNIIIADQGLEKPLICEVLAVGLGIPGISGDWIGCTAKVGELVIVPSFGGTKITFEGEEYLVYKDNEIIAKINE